MLAVAPFGSPPLAQTPMPGKAPPVSPTGRVTIGFSQEVTVLHPLMAANEVDHGVWWSVYSPLWGLDEKGDYYPVSEARGPHV